MSNTEAKPRVYVSVIFCDSVIREESNKLITAIRINDGYVVRPMTIAPSRPDGTPDLERSSIIMPPVRFVAIIRFCSEVATTFDWTIKGIRPSGMPLSSSEPERIPISIEPGAEGLTITSNIHISPLEAGEFWFEVWVDDVLATKAPVRISFGNPIGPFEAIPEAEYLRDYPSQPA